MRVLAVVLLLINVIGAVSSFYVLRSSGSQGDDDTLSTPLTRLRRSGILFGKLARNWAADDKRVVLRPLVEYEHDPWH
ncbi:Neuropeptide-Like Protein [Caenorhabditis elegans]|uniref:Neuropeptide-Like Protein n=1 Tax=Caenorhabditis elegans TaxID=6239 RepID=O61891_CAEEL|nr:Neuropeptide-Like Protein [Caenorhabditis elegans]CCD62621.1 Neuropeptide-Like Protein [Caenorhabditis elegans]|eukprot:NP_503373.2 Uncharacterized protein CELE_K10C9.1 [Caenorhabditis elegans]